MKNVVIIGGGTGISSVLEGIKEIENINLKVIVAVSDSGGSTGDIRKEYNIPAIGDIRKVASTLSENKEIFDLIMNYRFKTPDKNSTLNNHSLGNLFITALIETEKDFYSGIKNLSKILKIKGEIIPVTDYPNLTLKAIYEDLSESIGEHNIPNLNKSISDITYLNLDSIKPNRRAIEAILEANFIIFSPGSLYTSIIPNFIIPGIREAILQNNKAKIIYISNIVSQPGETTNYSAYNHINAIEKFLKYGIIDLVVINSQIPSDELLNRYQESNSNFIFADEKIKSSHVKVIQFPLLDNNNKLNIRHDSKKIKNCLIEIFKGE